LQHEHIITHKELVTAIMREPERARALLSTAVGCVVMREEHQRLAQVTREQPDLHGCEHYTVTDITWVDA
jgi:hypothetical protein